MVVADAKGAVAVGHSGCGDGVGCVAMTVVVAMTMPMMAATVVTGVEEGGGGCEWIKSFQVV